MGSSQKQETVPKLITDTIANLLAFYVAGQTLPQFHKRGIQFPALQGGDIGGLSAGGQGGGLLPPSSGQPGAGFIPGSILPDFSNLLALSGQSFFNQLPQQSLDFAPPPQGLGGSNPLNTLFGRG
jgi:hypothetical protein